jgi:integrase
LEKWVIPEFGRFHLAEVEPPDVRAFVGSLEREGLRPDSIRAILAPLKAMYATAVEDGAVRSNPTRDVRIGGRREEREEAEIRALTRSELGRLFACPPECWRLFFELLAHSGLRISEAGGLTWADVEFGARPRLLVRRRTAVARSARSSPSILVARSHPLAEHGPAALEGPRHGPGHGAGVREPAWAAARLREPAAEAACASD